MRVGILLPWVGGDLPAHLSFTCRSMAGGAATATLVLVHEARARRSVAPACRAQPNVDVVELPDGGVAAAVGGRLAARAGLDAARVVAKLAAVLAASPGALCEFKPAWGYAFAAQLARFSHWTYTDADVVFGHLDGWLRGPGPRFDVETWSFEGDAGRLFLRGQWALHARGNATDFLWEACDHLGARLEANLDYKLDHARALEAAGDRRAAKRAERARSDATRGAWDAAAAAARLDGAGLGECGGGLAAFVSAEGCYSCAVLASDAAAARGVVAAVAPLAHGDHEATAVHWFRGRLARCRGDGCDARLRAWRSAVRAGAGAPARAGAAPDAGPLAVVRDCADMRWICRTAPRAALRASPAALGPGDAVRVAARAGRDAVPAATRLRGRAPGDVVELPLFHFRKWIDYGAWASADDPGDGAAFVVEESGFRAHRRRGARRAPGRPAAPAAPPRPR